MEPDKATWGDVQYVFAMYYSDGFPKVFKCENELVKATLMYLDDPDAPEGVAFIRWLAVQDYLGILTSSEYSPLFFLLKRLKKDLKFLSTIINTC